MKNTQGKKADTRDLPDSADDIRHMQSDEGILDLPEVKDIPGQEFVRPLPKGEMADVTISSADEEGEGILDFDEDEDLDESVDVTAEEKEDLRRSSESIGTDDDEDVKNALLDDVDDDGTPLNEKNRLTGEDLDVPGSEEDDEDEEIGEEDEENNNFSLPDQED